MLTSERNENFQTESTLLQPPRDEASSLRARHLWQRVGRRARFFLSAPFANTYVEYLESLNEKEYANLTGTFLANGFVHLGHPRPTWARELIKTHFSGAIAAELENLPTLKLLRTLKNNPLDVVRAGANVKKLFKSRKVEAERAINRTFGVQARVQFLRNLIGESPGQFAISLMRYRNELDALLNEPYSPYSAPARSRLDAPSASADLGAGTGSERAVRRCAFSPEAQAGPTREEHSAAGSRGASPRFAQVTQLACSGPFVNTSPRATSDAAPGADTSPREDASVAAAAASVAAAGLDELRSMLSSCASLIDKRFSDVTRRLDDRETGIDGVIDDLKVQMDGLASLVSPAPRSRDAVGAPPSGSVPQAAQPLPSTATPAAGARPSHEAKLHASDLGAGFDPRLICTSVPAPSPCCLNTGMPTSSSAASGAQPPPHHCTPPSAPPFCGSCSSTAAQPAVPATPASTPAPQAEADLAKVMREFMGQFAARSPPSANAQQPAPTSTLAAAPLVAPSWFRASRIEGLAHSAAKVPDISRVQAQRPEVGTDPEQLKAARRQLSRDYPKAGLLRRAPAPGRTSRYVRVRHTLLESWAVYRFIVSAVPEDQRDGQLLAALIECATERGEQSGEQSNANSHYRWRTLEAAKTIDEFVDLLDQLYADSADNLVEEDWAAAVADKSISAGDMCFRLMPLLVDTPSIKRGKTLLLEHMAKDPNNRSAMAQLRACRDTVADLPSWRKVFANMEADAALLSKQSPARGVGSRGGAAPTRDLAAFGAQVDGSLPQDTHFHADMNMSLEMSQAESARALLAIVQNRAREQGLPLPLHLDDPAVPGLMQLVQAQSQPSEIAALKAAVDALAQQVGAQRRKGPAAQSGSASSPSSATLPAGMQSNADDQKQLAPFGQGRPRTYKPIYDLPKIYAFLGIPSSQLPPCQPGCTAAGGACKICVAFGIKEWPEFIKGGTLLPHQQYNHSAWKCPHIDSVVRKAAAEKGTEASVVEDLLTPLESPPWRNQ